MSTPSFSILLVGNELLDGRLQDSNSHFLAAELSANNFQLASILTVADKELEIVNALTYLSNLSQVVLVSGGLGPTSDDLTREAVAAFLEKPLTQSEEALKTLQAYYKSKKRPLNESNIKQTYFPKDSVVIENSFGTAPAFRVRSGNNLNLEIICLPGVPRELKGVWSEKLLPYFLESFPKRIALCQEHLRFFGVPESTLYEMVSACKLSSDVEAAYRASFPEIQLLLKSSNKDALKEAVKEILQKTGTDSLFSCSLKEDLSEVCHTLLLKTGKTISFAESCTGGLLSAYLLKNAGASAYYPGGIVSYANEVKVKELKVSQETLFSHGAVSEQCALEMAVGVREKFDTDIGISITGVAGPTGGSPEKPVGTFFVGYKDGDKAYAEKFFISQTRDRVQRYACFAALNTLRKELIK